MDNGNGTNPRFPTDASSVEDEHVVGPVIEQLLELLNQDERSRLAEVERRLDDPQALAAMVQTALREALRSNPAQMEAVFRPLVVTSLTRQDPSGNSVMKDAVTPVLGSATTSAVKQAFNDRMVSLSQTLSRTFSLDGLKWRIESIRTGQPFSEIAMRNSAVYEICDVYLIDRSSGLLMLRVGSENSIESNPDAAAGMLTAIQDFARDSAFAGDDTELSQITLSDHTIYLEDGPRAYLAAVVRGNAPLADIRPLFRRVLETYHKEHAQKLKEFTRDSHALAGETAPLETCLVSRGNVATLDRKRPVAKRYWIAAWLVFLFPLALLLAGWFAKNKQASTRASFVDNLRQTPGVMVSNYYMKDGRLHIYGVRDVSVLKPTDDEARAAGLKKPPKYDLMKVLVDHPEINLQRAQTKLSPPDKVNLQLEKQTVVAAGSSSDEWLIASKRNILSVPYVDHLDTSRLVTPSRQAAELRSLLTPSPEVVIQALGGEVQITGEAPASWIKDTQQILNGQSFIFSNKMTVEPPPAPPPPAPPPPAPPPPAPPAPPPPSTTWEFQSQNRTYSQSSPDTSFTLNLNKRLVLVGSSNKLILTEEKRILHDLSHVDFVNDDQVRLTP